MSTMKPRPQVLGAAVPVFGFGFAPRQKVLFDQDERGGGNPSGSNDGQPPTEEEKKFSQKDLNEIAAKERRKAERERDAERERIKKWREAGGLTDDDDDDAIAKYLSEGKKVAAKQPPTEDEISKKIENARKKKDEEYAPKLARLEKLEARNRRAAILEEIRGKTVTSVDPTGEDFILRLDNQLVYSEEDDAYYVGDGKGGIALNDDGKKKTIAEAVQEIAEKYPHLIASTSLPGSNGGGPRKPGAGGDKDPSKMTMAEYAAWRQGQS